MRNMIISLNKVNDIQDFINLVTKLPWKVYLRHEEYVVDAKSIMGIFSLDLSKPLGLSSAEDIPQQIYLQLQKYEIKD